MADAAAATSSAVSAETAGARPEDVDAPAGVVKASSSCIGPIVPSQTASYAPA